MSHRWRAMAREGGGKAFLALAVLFASARLHAEDWPSFRGPAGTGVSRDAAPLKWSDTEGVHWRVTLPEPGNSTPVVAQGRVFVTQNLGEERGMLCFDAESGQELWQTRFLAGADEPTNAYNPYCSASPATNGAVVIAALGSAGLQCLTVEGKRRWHTDLGEVDSWHGSGASPIIFEDRCFAIHGPGTNAAVVACDLASGKIVWRHAIGVPGDQGALGPTLPQAANHDLEHADGAGDMKAKGGYNGTWATPLILKHGDRDELVVACASRLVAYEPSTGQELWTCRGLPAQVIASPVAADGIIVALGHAHPMNTTVLAVRAGGSGDVSPTHRIWRRNLPKRYVGSSVVASELLFLLSDQGFLACLDLRTGATRWERRLRGQGPRGGSWSSLVSAEGRIFALNHSGECFVVNASADYKLRGVNSLAGETTCASPALSRGRFFLRTHRALWCVGNEP